MINITNKQGRSQDFWQGEALSVAKRQKVRIFARVRRREAPPIELRLGSGARIVVYNVYQVRSPWKMFRIMLILDQDSSQNSHGKFSGLYVNFIPGEKKIYPPSFCKGGDKGMFVRDFPFFRGRSVCPHRSPGYATGSIVGRSIIFGSELTATNNEQTFRVFKLLTPTKQFFRRTCPFSGGATANKRLGFDGNQTLWRWTLWRWTLWRQSPKRWTLWRQYLTI